MKKFIAAGVALLLFAGVLFGQTLEKGGVIALHRLEVTLAPGVSLDQYLDFMEKQIMPEAKKIFPEATYLFLKGIGENNQNQIGTFYYWESLEGFRTYWNDDGTPTEKGAAGMAKLQPLFEKLNALGTNTMVPGDWLILDR